MCALDTHTKEVSDILFPYTLPACNKRTIPVPETPHFAEFNDELNPLIGWVLLSLP